MKPIHYIIPLAVTLLAGACTSKPHWTLRGEIPADEASDVVIESLTFNGWTPIDTVTTDASGRFTYKGEPKGYPDIYRIVIPSGEMAYFPIDSLETVTIARAGQAWRLSGSPSAEIISRADSLIAASIDARGAEATLTDSLTKRALTEILLADPGSVGAYYIVSKRIGGKPLFNPDRRYDLRMIGAVANAYTGSRPNDPRTQQLTDMYMTSRRQTMTSIPVDTITADAIGHFDLELYDNTGKLRNLSDVVGANRLTLLNFTAYGADKSPAFNVVLNDIYKRYHSAGFEIYQVSIDPDETTWRLAAQALPWVTVYNSPVSQADNLMKYNVTSLPASFLINGEGDIVERIDDVESLSTAVSRRM